MDCPLVTLQWLYVVDLDGVGSDANKAAPVGN